MHHIGQINQPQWGGPVRRYIKWKCFPHNCPFVRGIHRSPVNSPNKGQWRGVLMLSLICTLNKHGGWVNNREAVDFRCHRAHDVMVMIPEFIRHYFYICLGSARPSPVHTLYVYTGLTSKEWSMRYHIANRPGQHFQYYINEASWAK